MRIWEYEEERNWSSKIPAVERIAENLEIRKNNGGEGVSMMELERIMQIMRDAMMKAFQREESVSLGDAFGRFEMRIRPAGRNIAGGKVRTYATSNHVVVFKAGKELKNTLNQRL